MERKLSTRSLRHPKYGVQGIEIGWLALTNYRAHTQTQKALSKYCVDRVQTVYIKKIYPYIPELGLMIHSALPKLLLRPPCMFTRNKVFTSPC